MTDTGGTPLTEPTTDDTLVMALGSPASAPLVRDGGRAA